MTSNPAPRRDATVETLADLISGFGRVNEERVPLELAREIAAEVFVRLKEQTGDWMPQLVDRAGLRYTVVEEDPTTFSLDVSFWGGTMWHTVETLWYKG
jgi:hypothetical protein